MFAYACGRACGLWSKGDIQEHQEQLKLLDTDDKEEDDGDDEDDEVHCPALGFRV